MRLIDADALKEVFAKHEDRKGYLIGDWEDLIDNAPTVELTSDIRWTDKVSVIDNGDIIDFYGRVLGHINLNSVKSGADMRKEAEND